MPSGSLNLTVTDTQSWQVSRPFLGLPPAPPTIHTLTASFGLGTAEANDKRGGADSLYFAILDVPGGQSRLLDLTNLADIMGFPLSFARVKFARFKLLGAQERAPDNATEGTPCAGVTLGGAPSSPWPMWLASGAQTIPLRGGAFGQCAQWDDQGPAGIAVTPAARNLLVANNDPVNAARLMAVLCGGSN